MPRAPNPAIRRERNAAIRADRARGLTVRQIAALHHVSLNQVHRVVRDVHIVLPNRWHRARQPKAAPLPPLLGQLHRVLSP